MRFVVQRVSEASVKIEGLVYSSINKGFLVLVGFEEDDTIIDIEWICQKLINIRIFDDKDGKMNLALNDVDGEILLVSQFTLFASTKKGNRPSFIKSAKPDVAIPLYQACISYLTKNYHKPIKTGQFGADMKVNLINDGPVTILIDSKNKE